MQSPQPALRWRGRWVRKRERRWPPEHSAFVLTQFPFQVPLQSSGWGSRVTSPPRDASRHPQTPSAPKCVKSCLSPRDGRWSGEGGAQAAAGLPDVVPLSPTRCSRL